MTRTEPNRTHRGFTLMELLVVVAIIGILAALLIPKIKIAIVIAKEGKTRVNLEIVRNAVRMCGAANTDANVGVLIDEPNSAAAGWPKYGFVSSTSVDAQLGAGVYPMSLCRIWAIPAAAGTAHDVVAYNLRPFFPDGGLPPNVFHNPAIFGTDHCGYSSGGSMNLPFPNGLAGILAANNGWAYFNPEGHVCINNGQIMHEGGQPLKNY